MCCVVTNKTVIKKMQVVLLSVVFFASVKGGLVRFSTPGVQPSFFSCENRPSGYYADIETGCQTYHFCDGVSRQFSYICPNNTLFQQRMMVCDHWFMVDCKSSEQDFSANSLIGQKDKLFVNQIEELTYLRNRKSVTFPKPDSKIVVNQPKQSSTTFKPSPAFPSTVNYSPKQNFISTTYKPSSLFPPTINYSPKQNLISTTQRSTFTSAASLSRKAKSSEIDSGNKTRSLIKLTLPDTRNLFFIPDGGDSPPPEAKSLEYYIPVNDGLKSMRFKKNPNTSSDKRTLSCPLYCHPRFLIPGTCHPCVLIK